MYEVVNGTSKRIFFGGEALEPNEKMVIHHNVFDTKSAKDEVLGVCDILSEYGEHFSYCYGNFTCSPKEGKDGTIFTIREK